MTTYLYPGRWHVTLSQSPDPPEAPQTTTLCRGCDLAFCDDHKYLLDQIATHGSHHVIDPSSPVGCSVCLGVVNLDMFQPA